VGKPTFELALTNAARLFPDAILAQNGDLVPFVLTEVPVGIGRPDLLLVLADWTSLSARRAAGLRLDSLSQAEALGVLRQESARVSVSPGRMRAHVRALEQRGWADCPTHAVIEDSVLIEAKVADWSAAVRQLSRTRWAVHRAALLLDHASIHRVDHAVLDVYELGLVAVAESGVPAWIREAPPTRLESHLDAWLGELVIRSIEN
jgi:hypothetical protein